MGGIGWRFGWYWVAKWVVLGGIPFYNLLKYNTLQGAFCFTYFT